MKVTIVGFYGMGNNEPTGQMIKIRTLHDALTRYTQHTKYSIVDTQYLSKNPLRLAWQLLKCLLATDKVIFFAAQRGRQYMFAFFYYVNKIFGKEIYHDCIGGALDSEISKNHNWKKYLNSFAINWMESPEQIEKLQNMGITNAIYLPNFKNLKAVTCEEMNAFSYQKPYRFCTFCRVERMKGIEDAVRAIHYVNEQSPGTATLDVYGLIETGEEEWFEQLQNEYKDDFRYCGVVGFNESTQAIAPYLAMLFPTRYVTEGMPGTIVDAMFAGVPVIARRWKWCDNMLTHNYNGIVYDFNTPEALNDILLEVCGNPDIITCMKGNCVKESQKYAVEQNIKRMTKELGIS